MLSEVEKVHLDASWISQCLYNWVGKGESLVNTTNNKAALFLLRRTI